MKQSRRQSNNLLAVIPTWQTLPITKRIRVCWLALVLAIISAPQSLQAELFDSLDAYPPRWQLDTSDCDARIQTHKNLPRAGTDGGGCEAVTFHAALGSEAILVYPLEPLQAIDDLVARVSVQSARAGARVGLRVRFPYARDPESHRPVSKLIYGSAYDRIGKFQSLVVSDIQRPLKVQIAKLIAKFSRKVDLRDPYVDAVIVNAYSGPGQTTLQLDDLSVKGMIPVGDHGRVNETHHAKTAPSRMLQMKLPGDSFSNQIKSPFGVPSNETADGTAPAFPPGQIIRILEHRGEPLRWVRSLGFDAVLLASPPTSDILREAIQSGISIYAPPPVAPDPALQTLLDPLVAWYLGGGVALDSTRVEQTDATVRRLRSMPQVWRRPIVVAPTEDWAAYTSFADAIVASMPGRNRRLTPDEQARSITRCQSRIGNRPEFAIAVSSAAPPAMQNMNRSIANAIGAPEEACFRWQSMWTQAMRSLEHRPRALLFRSSESLVSGAARSHQRSMALSFVNRFIAMLSPWIAAAKQGEGPPLSNPAFRSASLISDDSEFILISSTAERGNEVLAGDGQSLRIQLTSGQARRTAWRLSDFSVERLDIKSLPEGPSIEIVSPDVAEVIVLSSSARTGAQLHRHAQRFARQAASDRWQLAEEQLAAIHEAWNHSTRMGATDSLMPVDLLTVAARTIRDAEPFYRANDTQNTLRLARRADAWSMRAAWQLSDALLNRKSLGPASLISCPPIDDGRPMLQVAWAPLMGDEGWSRNLLTSGDLDTPGVLSEGRWHFGRRELERASSSAQWIDREYFSGRGAIRLTAESMSKEPLGGGYEGTAAMLASPSVVIKKRQAIRVDAMIRTIGFGGPHQGVLVYDSVGGQQMGVLVRGATQWTPVRLYRQSDQRAEVRVMFEIIGDGEAIVDEVGIQAWDPQPLQPLPFRPIDD